MQNKNKNHFRLREVTKYDYIKYVEPERREQIVQNAMLSTKSLDIRGSSNPNQRRNLQAEPIQRHLRLGSGQQTRRNRHPRKIKIVVHESDP